MQSNQKDYILNQVLEMFPQLETSIVHLVLSEREFKVDDAIPSLALLAQSVEVPLAQTIVNQPEYENSFPSLLPHETIPLSSKPQSSKSSKSSKKRKNGSAQNKRKQEMKTEISNVETEIKKETFSKPSELDECLGDSVYLPYYGTTSTADDVQLLGMSNELQLQNPSSMFYKGEIAEQTSASLNKSLFFDVSVKSPSINSSKLNVVKLSSYTSVGEVNGKRLVFEGSGIVCVKHVSLDKNLSKHDSQLKNLTYYSQSKSNKNSSTQVAQPVTIQKKSNEKFSSKNSSSPHLNLSHTDIDLNKNLSKTSSCFLNEVKQDTSHNKARSKDTTINSNHKSVSKSASITTTNNTDTISVSNPLQNSQNPIDESGSSSVSTKTTHHNNAPKRNDKIINASILNSSNSSFTTESTTSTVEQNKVVSVSHSQPNSISTKQENIQKVSSYQFQTNYSSSLPCLYILRGLSGSGKSTLARQILSKSHGQILSSDDYFMTRNGYEFEWIKVSEAHAWNQRRASECMSKGLHPVIIDNTNSSSWEMKPYMVMAIKYRYKIIIQEPNTWWRFKVGELAKRNTHRVPKDTIKAMLERFERNVTIRSVLGEESYHKYVQICLNPLPPDSQIKDKNGKSVMAEGNRSDQVLDNTKLTNNKIVTTPTKRDKTNSINESLTIHTTARNPQVSNVVARNNTPDKNEEILHTPTKQYGDVFQKQASLKSDSSNLPSEVSISPGLEQSKFNDEATSPPSISLNSNIHPVKSDESISSSQAEEKSPCSENQPSAATKKKRKPKTLAARFPAKALPDLNVSNDSWSSFMNMIDAQSAFEVSRSPPKQPAITRCDSSSQTNEDYFILVSKLEQCVETEGSDLVLTTDGNRFQSSVAVKRKKIIKITYDKSTSTDDLIQESSEESDLKTLQLLFPDYAMEYIRHFYDKCGKQLDWTTDVIAESSLFGDNANFTPRDKDEPSTSMSLDAYYDTLFKDQSASPKQDESRSNVVSNPADCLQLQLSAHFLRQLVTLFGDNNDAVDVKDSSLMIGYDLAFAIYNSWKSMSQTNLMNEAGIGIELRDSNLSPLYSLITSSPRLNNAEQLRKDEELARKIQDEEKRQTDKTSRNRKFNNKSALPQPIFPNVSSPSKWSVDQVQTESLSQIISDECAALQSVKRQTKKFADMKLATQMKREELHTMHPNLPKTLLDDVFAANNYNLEDTMFAVNCIFDEKNLIKTSMVSQSLEPYFVSHRGKNRPLNQNGLDCEVDESVKSNRLLTFDQIHTDTHATYDEIRAEANMQRGLIIECQKKAAVANHQKKGALSFFYAQQGRDHQKLLREANLRAAAVIYKRMNEGRSPNELDLHGLHVDEAIDTLRSVLEKLQRDDSSARYLTIITGRGLNSSDGVPKLKKAVLEWLKNKNIEHDLLNDGCVKISW